jgi:hypothetical protein
VADFGRRRESVRDDLQLARVHIDTPGSDQIDETAIQCGYSEATEDEAPNGRGGEGTRQGRGPAPPRAPSTQQGSCGSCAAAAAEQDQRAANVTTNGLDSGL